MDGIDNVDAPRSLLGRLAYFKKEQKETLGKQAEYQANPDTDHKQKMLPLLKNSLVFYQTQIAMMEAIVQAYAFLEKAEQLARGLNNPKPRQDLRKVLAKLDESFDPPR